MARGLSKAMDEAGIRPSQKSRRVGDYVLEDLIADGPGYQDWSASHTTIEGDYRRIRHYLLTQALSEKDRDQLRRAAQREYRILQTLDHPGILRCLEYKEHDHGPALVFRYDPKAVRLDHFLAEKKEELTIDTRLDLIKQIADAVRYAHGKRVIHRALSPQSILVVDPDSETPKVKIFNWQIGVRQSASTSAITTHADNLVEGNARVYMAPESLQAERNVTEAADVFSLGAIAYHLFSGQPPAENLVELGKRLREQKGLRISATLDGTGPKLEELIHGSTHPDVLTRDGSVEEFLVRLDDLVEETNHPGA